MHTYTDMYRLVVSAEEALKKVIEDQKEQMFNCLHKNVSGPQLLDSVIAVTEVSAVIINTERYFENAEDSQEYGQVIDRLYVILKTDVGEVILRFHLDYNGLKDDEQVVWLPSGDLSGFSWGSNFDFLSEGLKDRVFQMILRSIEQLDSPPYFAESLEQIQ